MSLSYFESDSRFYDTQFLTGEKTIPSGYISLETFPVRLAQTDFLARSSDFQVTFFLHHPEKIDRYFDQAAFNWPFITRSAARVYMPCATDRRLRQDRTHYTADLVVPPNVCRRQELLTEGLIVPGMHIVTTVERDGVVKGFVLESDFSGGQEYFSPQARIINELRRNQPDPELQGLITDVPSVRGHRPCVMLKNDSVHHPDVIAQNREAIGTLDTSFEKYWWDIDIEALRDVNF
jgi:hypothetical protein